MLDLNNIIDWNILKKNIKSSNFINNTKKIQTLIQKMSLDVAEKPNE